MKSYPNSFFEPVLLTKELSKIDLISKGLIFFTENSRIFKIPMMSKSRKKMHCMSVKTYIRITRKIQMFYKYMTKNYIKEFMLH